MKYIFAIILSILFIPANSQSEVNLEDFVFANSELPAGCKTKIIQSGDRLPCDLQTNPAILEKGKALDCFKRTFNRDSTLLSKVKKGLFSVYEGSSEMGVFGIETDSEKTATEIYDQFKLNNPNDESSELFHSNHVLILLWHDRNRTSAFEEFKKLIIARLKP